MQAKQTDYGNSFYNSSIPMFAGSVVLHIFLYKSVEQTIVLPHFSLLYFILVLKVLLLQYDSK